MIRRGILEQIGLKMRFECGKGGRESDSSGEGVIQRRSNKFKHSATIFIGTDTWDYQEL